MSILVLTPIEDEVRALASALSERGLEGRSVPAGRLSARTYDDDRLILVQGGLGKVQFGLHALHALDNVDDAGAIVCAGVAGGLSDAVSVGDVVVATATIEHDFNWPRGAPPSFQGHEPYISALKSLGLPAGTAFKLHFGPVASGDEGINDGVRARELRDNTGALAVAWEGAGGARAAEFGGLPFLEVRGISDMADSEAESVWRQNLPGAMRNVAVVLEALVRVIAEDDDGVV